jgi:hypothetical protein
MRKRKENWNIEYMKSEPDIILIESMSWKNFFCNARKRRAYGFTYSKENAEKAVSNPTISDGETYVRILSDVRDKK